MKRHSYLMQLSLCFTLFYADGFCQIPSSSSMNTSTKGSSTIETLKPLPSENPSKKAPSKEHAKNPAFTYMRAAGPDMAPLKATYFHPGVLVYNRGLWTGNDYLFNLAPEVAVYVSVLKPEGDSLVIADKKIQEEVELIFQKAGIKSIFLVEKKQPPLPFFEIQILTYPVMKGYVASCQGRLFESVKIDRFKLEQGMAFQAITWEKDTLIVGPKDNFLEQLITSVKEIAGAFTERFDAYKKAENEQE